MFSLISIIIPLYNHDEHLPAVLSSIVRQTYRPLEIIIVDDGSTPPVDTKKYSAGDIPITWIRQENKGAPAARNAGLDKAAGEYIIFWDADVIAEPDMLEKMVNRLEEEKDASFAYCNSRFGWKKFRIHPFDETKLKEMNYIHSTTLIRKKDAIRWDESLKRFQDWDLWLTMVEQRKKGVWIDEYLYQVVPHRGGISSWLPSCAYKKPWRYLPFFYKKVRAYEKAKDVIKKKHQM